MHFKIMQIPPKFSFFSEFTLLSNSWRRTLKWPISIPSDFWEFSLKDLNGIFKSEISLKAFLTFKSHVIRICLQENTFGSNPRQNIFEEKIKCSQIICRPILFTCETNVLASVIKDLTAVVDSLQTGRKRCVLNCSYKFISWDS